MGGEVSAQSERACVRFDASVGFVFGFCVCLFFFKCFIARGIEGSVIRFHRPRIWTIYLVQIVSLIFLADVEF